MITTDKEFYSSPYYFFLRDKGKDYSLYFSAEQTIVEARKKDEMIKVPKDKVQLVKKYLEKLLKDKTKKSTKDMKGEIEELVSMDGSMTNSKIPILDPRLHPKKTMDQTVAASRITNDPISRGYRTYYGESVEEVSEEIVEEEETLSPITATAAETPWGILPALVLIPGVIILSIVSLMSFELMRGLYGYNKGTGFTSVILKPIAEMFTELPK